MIGFSAEIIHTFEAQPPIPFAPANACSHFPRLIPKDPSHIFYIPLQNIKMMLRFDAAELSMSEREET